MPGGTVGLVGLFDPDPRKIRPDDLSALEILAHQLSGFIRLLPQCSSHHPLAGLSGRPGEVALLVGAGLTNADIAAKLCLAEDTVKKYVSRALQHTGCRRRTQLALKFSGHAEEAFR